MVLEDEHGAPLCSDCRCEAELFMVKDTVWPIDEHGAPVVGWLCVRCLEQRIGRRLAPKDFQDCHALHEVHLFDGWGTRELADRLGGACPPSLECRSCVVDVAWAEGFRLVPRRRRWWRRLGHACDAADPE